MTYKFYISLFLTFVFVQYVNGQDALTGYDLESRNKADLVFECLLEVQNIQQTPYVLLSSGNSSYFIILNRKSHYTMVWGKLLEDQSFKVTSLKNQNKSDKLIESAFNIKNYHDGFISWDSEFYADGYEMASGAPTYFVMKDSNGNRFGESVLSMLVSPNPIDKKIYGYMATELINSSE